MRTAILTATLATTLPIAVDRGPVSEPPTEAMFFQDVAWSPDGEWLAYSRYAPEPGAKEYRREDWSVVVARSDGSEERVLAENAQWVAWSPDGERLVFGSARDGDWDLYTIGVDGSDRTRITSSGANERAPAWSPDGSTLAYTSDRDGNSEIYLLSLEADAEPRRLTFDDADDHNPVWSPDGSSLVFYRAVDGGGADQIHLIRADGSEELKVTDDRNLNIFPAFLPDGRISWTRTSAESGLERLQLFDPDQGSVTTIGPQGAFFGRWSPDGSQVALIAGDWPAAAIYVMGADGAPVRKIVN